MDDQAMKLVIADIEKQLIGIMVKNVSEQRMNEEQARKMARDFLALLPIHDQHELLVKLGGFSKAYRDAKGVYLKYAAPYDEAERQRKLELMSKHIQSGQIEHALAV